jgi:hypothetical protein
MRGDSLEALGAVLGVVVFSIISIAPLYVFVKLCFIALHWTWSHPW